MASFTPGPWFVHDFADAAVSLDPSPSDVTVSCDHPASITVASMGRAMTATLDEARANARLIAAAPDLLTALQVVRMSAGWQQMSDLTRKIIVDALAKAEVQP